MRKLAAMSGVEKGTVFALADQSVSIGRADENLIRLDDNDVSRAHAVLELENGEYRVRDLGSRNGTFVNGQRVTDVKLSPGDSLRVGLVELVYEKDRARGPEPTPSPSKEGNRGVGLPSSGGAGGGFLGSVAQRQDRPVLAERKTSRKAWVIFWVGVGIADFIFVAWYAHHLIQKRNVVPVAAVTPLPPPALSPVRQSYADGKGRFVCELPEGWRAEPDATATDRSKVAFVSGSDEIRVIAQDSALPELTESDRAAAVAAFGEMLERARAGGANGKLVGTSWREVAGARALVVEVEVESPRYSWMRQVKFRRDGMDHTVALYVGSAKRREALEALFETFLSAYHGAGK